MGEAQQKILVFRLGSIGDFVIALPCFRMVRQRNPNAEVILLTNIPSSQRIIPAEHVLQGTGYVDRYIKYPGATRDIADMWRLRRAIAAEAPDELVYLVESRGAFSIYRDCLFFKACGIRRINGAPLFPWQGKLRRPTPGSDLWEQEAHRLRRLTAMPGASNFNFDIRVDLNLMKDEVDAATRLLNEAFPAEFLQRGGRFLGMSIGTNQEINQWSEGNWRRVVQVLGNLGLGLVLVGGSENRERSEQLARHWAGPYLNLCGSISPRLSAGVLGHACLFIGHDSGPMHLAAAVGTPCVGIFSRRNLPGKWFPLGSGHHILYPTARSGNIHSITPRQVIASVIDALETVAHQGAPVTMRRVG